MPFGQFFLSWLTGTNSQWIPLVAHVLYLPKVHHFYCPSVEIWQSFAIFFTRSLTRLRWKTTRIKDTYDGTDIFCLIYWGCFGRFTFNTDQFWDQAKDLKFISKNFFEPNFKKISFAIFQRKFQLTLKVFILLKAVMLRL